MASEVIGDNMHMDTRVFKVADFKSGVIEVIQHHMPISHSPCRRRYIGPLPSCYYEFGHGKRSSGSWCILKWNIMGAVRDSPCKFSIGFRWPGAFAILVLRWLSFWT